MRDRTSAVLHGVRLLGFASAAAVATRTGLDPADTTEELLDQQARGRVIWSEFGGAGGWSLTETGRRENERLLARELDAVPGGRAALTRAYDEFLPANGRLQQACTDWQLRPTSSDHLAPNHHDDPAWDDRVLTDLEAVAADLGRIEPALTAVLPRLSGYHVRFTTALGHRRVDDHDDSCHRTWFELHEDLLATLGLPRG